MKLSSFIDLSLSGKINRSDLFIVTKLPFFGMRPGDVRTYFDASLKSLGLDYIDLYLVHSPVAVEKDKETGFMKMYEGGKVRNLIVK